MLGTFVYRDTFTTALFGKVSESNIGYQRIIHLFSANYKSSIILDMEYCFMSNVKPKITCRKQVTGAVILLS